MADKYERFIASYLRLNAYFTITNFIVHAGEDPQRVRNQHIGNHTETDILGIRMPYSNERTGPLHIANDLPLVAGSDGKIDVVIAEVKSGKDNKPNAVWRKGNANHAISYVVRFVGLHDEHEINDVVNALASTFCFEDDKHRLRYIIFSHEPNEHYVKMGVTYIKFRDVVQFLIAVRGQSWIGSNLGVASTHEQWDEILHQVFSLANAHELTEKERLKRIENYLES